MIYQPILSDDTDIIKVVVASSDKEVRPDVIELQDIDSTSEIKVDSNGKTYFQISDSESSNQLN